MSRTEKEKLAKMIRELTASLRIDPALCKATGDRDVMDGVSSSPYPTAFGALTACTRQTADMIDTLVAAYLDGGSR